MQNITQINDNTWMVDEDIVRLFLLVGKEKAILLDGGRDNGNARDIARSITDLPLEILITHADQDHCASNGQFDYFFMHPADAFNYYNIQHQTGAFKPIYDGESINLGDRALEIIHVPGHTPGSIAILDVNARALFSGDTVQDGDIFLFGVERDLNAYIYSLERLEKLKDRFDTVYPCHGTIPLKPEHITELLKSARIIMSGHKAPIMENVWKREVFKYEFDSASFLCEKDYSS